MIGRVLSEPLLVLDMPRSNGNETGLNHARALSLVFLEFFKFLRRELFSHVSARNLLRFLDLELLRNLLGKLSLNFL